MDNYGELAAEEPGFYLLAVNRGRFCRRRNGSHHALNFFLSLDSEDECFFFKEC